MSDATAARRLELVRAAVFGYAAAWLVLRARYVWDVTALPSRRFQPVGILAWLDWQPERPVVMATAMVTLAAVVLTAASRRVEIWAPLGAVGMLVIATYTSSFGQIFHTEHLLVLHLLVLAAHALVTAAPAGSTRSNDPWRAAWALTMLNAVTAVTYVVAGVTKLRMSGLDWVSGDVLRSWVAADNLRKALLDDPYSRLGGAMSGVGWIWPAIAAATLAVELGAPVAVLVGRLRIGRQAPIAAIWVGAAWLFHLGVLVVMAISFPYQLSGVAYLAFLPVERAEAWARSVAHRARPYTRPTWPSSC